MTLIGLALCGFLLIALVGTEAARTILEVAHCSSADLRMDVRAFGRPAGHCRLFRH
jgi:hypothetical protein